ncbi:MAG: hypothetical protein IJP90_04855 [Treponema sp.]|nr:hypothetical protein [Treponema sp.]MBR0099025.1 hypothetical protein [Treponema sp.]
MEKKVFIAGKELPDGNEFASGFASHKRRVAVTSVYHKDSEEVDSAAASSGGISQFPWNRNSALSTRAMTLGVFNEFSAFDEAVVVFDEMYFSRKFGLGTQNSDSIKILEESISSYHYLISEIIPRLSKSAEKFRAKTPIKIVFLHKMNYSQCDSVLEQKGVERNFSSPLVSAASAAFGAFAENTAATIAENELFYPLLISCPKDNDYINRDGSLAGWICDYMNALDNLKNPFAIKDKLSWIKAGSKKPGGGFRLFGKE